MERLAFITTAKRLGLDLAEIGELTALWSARSEQAGAMAELAAAEQRCCAFVEVRLDFDPRRVRLHVALRPGQRPEPGGPAARAAQLLGAFDDVSEH